MNKYVVTTFAYAGGFEEITIKAQSFDVNQNNQLIFYDKNEDIVAAFSNFHNVQKLNK